MGITSYMINFKLKRSFDHYIYMLIFNDMSMYSYKECSGHSDVHIWGLGVEKTWMDSLMGLFELYPAPHTTHNEMLPCSVCNSSGLILLLGLRPIVFIAVFQQAYFDHLQSVGYEI